MTRKTSSFAIYGLITIIASIYLVEAAILSEPPVSRIPTISLEGASYIRSNDNLPDYQYATYELSQLVSSLEQSIQLILDSTAIYIECLDQQGASILTKAGITNPDQQDFILSDPTHGLGSASTLPLWVQAIAGGSSSYAAKLLQDYFYLESSQIVQLFSSNSPLVTCATAINYSIVNAYSCSSIPCDPHYLTELQWSSQSVTLNPVGGMFPPQSSVIAFNNTFSSFPEISYYLTNYFIEQYKVDPTEYNITFSMPLVANLLDNSANTTSKVTLLSEDNEKFLFAIGAGFDLTNELILLSPIQTKFNLPSLYHAHVLYKYLQYLVDEFSSDQGQVIPGQPISQAIYSNISTAASIVLDDLTARLILKNLTNEGIDCVTLLVDSSGLLTEDAARQICSSPLLTPFGTEAIGTLVTACSNPGDPQTINLINELGFTKAEFFTFCATPGENTFYSLLTSQQLYLKNYYNCSLNYPDANRCSRQEVAILQWGSSVITQNPPPELQNELTPSDSLQTWYPDNFTKPFEYIPTLELVQRDFGAFNITPIDYVTAKSLLTFDCLFNQAMVQRAFLLFQKGDLSNFAKNFSNTDPSSLVAYLQEINNEWHESSSDEIVVDI